MGHGGSGHVATGELGSARSHSQFPLIYPAPSRVYAGLPGAIPNSILAFGRGVTAAGSPLYMNTSPGVLASLPGQHHSRGLYGAQAEEERSAEGSDSWSGERIHLTPLHEYLNPSNASDLCAVSRVHEGDSDVECPLPMVETAILRHIMAGIPPPHLDTTGCTLAGTVMADIERRGQHEAGETQDDERT